MAGMFGSVFTAPGQNILTCTWSPVNSILFQIANFWLFILYVGDFITFSNLFYKFLFLRTVLAGAALFFTVWAAWVLCSPDTALWNFVFLIYNVIQMVVLIYRERIKKPNKPSFEKLYSLVYSPISFPLNTYNCLIENGEVWILKDGQEVPGEALCNGKIVQVISGRVAGTIRNGGCFSFKEGDILNHDSWNFSSYIPVKSPIVSDYTAESECVIISWSYAMLSSTLGTDEKRQFSALLTTQLNSILLYITAVLDPTLVVLRSKSSRESLDSSEVSGGILKLRNNGEMRNGGGYYNTRDKDGGHYRGDEMSGELTGLIEAESNV